MHYCSFIPLSFECFVMQQQLTYAGTPTQIPPYILPRPRMELLHKWNQLRLNFHKHAHYWVNNITLPSTGEKGWRWSKWSWGRNLQLLSANYTISLLLHRAGGEGDGMLEMSPTLGTVCNAWSHMPTNAQTLEFSYFWNSRLLLYVTDGSAFHILFPHPDSASSSELFFQAHVTFFPGSHDPERAPACALVSGHSALLVLYELWGF